jgi:hypothetical protein
VLVRQPELVRQVAQQLEGQRLGPAQKAPPVQQQQEPALPAASVVQQCP